MAYQFQQPYLGWGGGLQTLHGASGAVGGWVELGRTTLGSASNTITVSSLADKRYLMVLNSMTGNSVSYGSVVNRFNSDTGSNYAERRSNDGAADGTGVSQGYVNETYGGMGTTPCFGVGYISNLSSKEKLFISHYNAQKTAGAANAPERWETVGKWANTSNSIDEIIKTSTSTPTYNTGSEVVVLGWDPADTHTTNFWEELASVELGAAADSLDTSVFTAKKYLWVQAYIKNSSTINIRGRVGNTTVDTGSNYADRDNENGGTDATSTSANQFLTWNIGGYAYSTFINMFWINNSANEKLCIGSQVIRSTAGAATAPIRREGVIKWANTSAQINRIELFQDDAGSFDTGSIIKVWGAN